MCWEAAVASKQAEGATAAAIASQVQAAVASKQVEGATAAVIALQVQAAVASKQAEGATAVIASQVQRARELRRQWLDGSDG